MTVGMVASNCASYSGVLGSEFYATRLGNPLSRGLLHFWRERDAEPAGGEPTCGEMSLTNPVIDCVRRDPEPGRNLLHAQLARS